MRLNICSCLLAFVLGCKLTAAIIHQIVEEKTSVTLPCPHAVDRKVTWSREKDGRKVDILSTDGDRDIRHDTDRRYNIQADKSFYIIRVNVSDSGRYFCNEAAVELTVIPSGTIRRDAPERTSVTLKCSHDDGGSLVPAWSRNNGEIQQPGRFYVSPADKTLTIRDVQPDDSGLYYCDGKPAVYLNVIERQVTERVNTTAAAQLKLTDRQEAQTETEQAVRLQSDVGRTLNLGLVVGIVVPVILLLVLIIVYFILRQRLKKQGSGEKYPVYDEIQDICMTPPTNGVEGFAGDSYCMADLPAPLRLFTLGSSCWRWSQAGSANLRGETGDPRGETGDPLLNFGGGEGEAALELSATNGDDGTNLPSLCYHRET
ncbi:hypothetical protein L3Q82_003226 [Scortum barcoo]|uniref:Uncharacterized protein n=1 Tax=Scortum barcoo TaxID=214431 RepID=A0ACB8VRU0_9TELE|nr:hypothetical protein L3Q82_003226 [Scortum barcoo]